jgi:CheY-like chemotaxis protein
MKKIKNVLLIDDDEPTNFINKKIILGSDLVEAIHIAQSGQEALNFLSHQPEQTGQNPLPDLIFLDINMPAMDGWEFLANYKKLKTAKKENVIIVMLTTSLNPDDEVKAKEMKEVKAFRNKPLTRQLLGEIATEYF